jgi:hypothetical protein
MSERIPPRSTRRAQSRVWSTPMSAEERREQARLAMQERQTAAPRPDPVSGPAVATPCAGGCGRKCWSDFCPECRAKAFRLARGVA